MAANRVAPSLEEFEALAADAFAALPAQMRRLCEGLEIFVADFADAETLAAVSVDDPFELTGVYIGVDLSRKSVADPTPGPDRVVLYRRPILDEWADHGTITLGELVSHVLVHEIGHHFGLSDDDMHRIEDED
ncbi:metallopeptidase family protein [Maricaulis sp.]|uniref:metallopeptidase family protein n=1 Tax=Maricaulis sp. TaxID=1486257 RepID=UPI002B26BDF8|nr:metallopeptidase family protein [Maricaulis sp.]